MFTLLKQEGRARRGTFETVHGTIQTPVFMNVGTSATIKGGISTQDLYEVGCQVELSNTYHLHVRPGDDVIYDMGGIHKFFNWDRPVLTDSGGFQVFSLSQLRKISEEGVQFASHVDGRRIFMGPEESMQIQSNIASTIAMAFDECIENPAPRDYVKASVDRTTRWLERCKNEMNRLNSLPGTINKNQLLFGINQGGTYDDIRIDHMKRISEFDLPGYAIGGLAVGEEAEVMYHVIDAVEPFMPKDKPRYLMGVGTPVNILEAVYRGVDFFDCVMPSRNARHGYIFTWKGTMNINNRKYQRDPLPIDPDCNCPSHFFGLKHHNNIEPICACCIMSPISNQTNNDRGKNHEKNNQSACTDLCVDACTDYRKLLRSEGAGRRTRILLYLQRPLHFQRKKRHGQDA